VFNKFFFFENPAVYKTKWEKYGTAGQATNEYMAHAHCMLNTKGYKYTPRIYYTYFLLKN